MRSVSCVRSVLVLVAALLGTGREATTALAQDGAYIVEPWNGSYTAVKIQPGDQKIVAAGAMTITNPDNTTESRMAIARYDSLGYPDSTYGSGGVAAPALGTSSERGYDLVLQPDGKAVVSGYNSANGSFAVARFRSNGTLDNGFGFGGWTTFQARPGFNPAEAVGLQSTGKIVVAGTSALLDSEAEVARFTAAGTIDSGKGGFGKIVQGKAIGYSLDTFGGMPNAGLHDLSVQPDNKLVAVGYAYPDGTSRRLLVARYTASGTLDTTFNGNGYSLFLPSGISDANGWGVALQSDGKIVVTGFCTGTDGDYDMLVTRFNANGSLDTSFGGGSGYVRLDNGAVYQSRELGKDVAIQPDGKIVAVASTLVTGNPNNVMVARFNVDGMSDATFAAGGYKLGVPLPDTGFHSFSGRGVALQSDGSIIVAGDDDQGTSGGHPLLMRFFGTASPLLAAGSPTGTPATATLTVGAVKPLVDKAIAIWQARGADTSRLGHIDIAIADLGGTTLGLASGHSITLDDNAAGWGWDAGRPTGRGRRMAAGRMDLLSAMVHEVGHLLGHDHDEAGVMAATLTPGVRQLLADPIPGPGQADPAAQPTPARPAFASLAGRGRRARAFARR